MPCVSNPSREEEAGPPSASDPDPCRWSMALGGWLGCRGGKGPTYLTHFLVEVFLQARNALKRVDIETHTAAGQREEGPGGLQVRVGSPGEPCGRPDLHPHQPQPRDGMEQSSTALQPPESGRGSACPLLAGFLDYLS